jgi:hypothetical protein
MIHFLKNNKGKTIIECESMYGDLEDLFSSIYLINYTNDFMEQYSLNKKRANDFMLGISNLDALRNLWWETECENEKWDSLDHFIRHHYTSLAQKIGLKYSNDAG